MISNRQTCCISTKNPPLKREKPETKAQYYTRSTRLIETSPEKKKLSIFRVSGHENYTRSTCPTEIQMHSLASAFCLNCKDTLSKTKAETKFEHLQAE